METKEAIEWLSHTLVMDSDKANQTIILLQQGEKYKAIVRDIEYELNWHKPECPLHCAKLEISRDEEHLDEILDLIDNIKRKYFPKQKETIIS